jgi:hypothetical protein
LSVKDLHLIFLIKGRDLGERLREKLFLDDFHLDGFIVFFLIIIGDPEFLLFISLGIFV